MVIRRATLGDIHLWWDALPLGASGKSSQAAQSRLPHGQAAARRWRDVSLLLPWWWGSWRYLLLLYRHGVTSLTYIACVIDILGTKQCRAAGMLYRKRDRPSRSWWSSLTRSLSPHLARYVHHWAMTVRPRFNVSFARSLLYGLIWPINLIIITTSCTEAITYSNLSFDLHYTSCLCGSFN